MLFSLVAWFVSIIFLAVVPSWWLYKADAIGWRSSFWLFKLRDIIASALYGTAFLVLLLTPFFMQRWRRKLRSESESRPTGGYR